MNVCPIVATFIVTYFDQSQPYSLILVIYSNSSHPLSI